MQSYCIVHPWLSLKQKLQHLPKVVEPPQAPPCACLLPTCHSSVQQPPPPVKSHPVFKAQLKRCRPPEASAESSQLSEPLLPPLHPPGFPALPPTHCHAVAVPSAWNALPVSISCLVPPHQSGFSFNSTSSEALSCPHHLFPPSALLYLFNNAHNYYL